VFHGNLQFRTDICRIVAFPYVPATLAAAISNHNACSNLASAREITAAYTNTLFGTTPRYSRQENA
jgi:hypothetical protein